MVTALLTGPARRPALWRRTLTVFLLALLHAWLLPCLVAAEVSISLSPESVPAGEGAQLTIRIVNGNFSGLKAPEVPNLIFNGPNRGRQISMVNGVTTSSTTLSYAVGSMTAGEYAIPPFTVTVDGTEVETDALKLTVTPSASQTPAGLPPGGTPGQTPAAGQDSLGFLTVEFAGKNRSHAWVGEIAPVCIKAWLPADARVSLTPLQPSGSAFTLHNLSSQPQQSTEMHDGKRWLVVTWYGGLSATKAGTSPPDLSMKISVQIPDPAGGGRRTGDPVFDQFFVRMIQKEVELHSKNDQSANLEIRPLPKAGRPADFDGAVGKFAFGRSSIPRAWKTGEPQQITAEISGEGNFQLLRQPAVIPEKSWKSYSGQSSFAAQDAASFSGVSTFRFSQVPRRAGTQELKLAFSYFDPDLASYQTVETPAQSVEVTGADLPEEPLAATTAPAAPAAPDGLPLAPPHQRAGMPVVLTPPAWRPFFPWLTGACAVLTLTGLLARPLTQHWQDPARRARLAAEKSLGAATAEAARLAALGDVSGFFGAARRALQTQLALLWQQPAAAITLADVTRRMPPGSPVIQLFEEADRQEFSRSTTLPAPELPAWRQRLDDALTAIAPAPPR